MVFIWSRGPIGITAPSPSVRYDVLWAADWQAGIRKHTHRQAIDTHTIDMSSILLHTVPDTANQCMHIAQRTNIID